MEKKINVTTELLSNLQIRVTEKTLNPDKILFTAEPLKSMIEPPENATAEQLEQVAMQNKAICEENEKLCREAKSLKTLLTEAGIVPVEG